MTIKIFPAENEAADTKITVKQIDDGAANVVLAAEDGELILPSKFLPKDAAEGDYLTIKIFPAENEAADTKITVKQIDNGAADVVLAAEDGELILPSNFLPENVNAGDTLIIKICRDEDKTNAALDEARQLLKELE